MLVAAPESKADLSSMMHSRYHQHFSLVDNVERVVAAWEGSYNVDRRQGL